MKSANLGSASYTPGPVPTGPAQLCAFLADELRRIGAALALVSAGHVEVCAVAPSKPRAGDVRLADGTNWNPGSGAGVYAFYSGDWHFLG